MNLKGKLIVIIIPIIFFIISFLTISNYGISWDEPAHFTRGSAYLNYFLTGNLQYQNIKSSDRRSVYQDNSYTAKFFREQDSGHPPINGILAALSNYIFYQKLGIFGDIEAYHLFNILSAVFLVFIVSIFAAQTYGLFAAFISGLTLASYPLFFSEGHFNIKDPVETAFFAATIWAFWNALKKYNYQWLIASILFFSLAMGTKFNILFLPLIIFPWLFFKYKLRLKNLTRINIPKIFLFFLVLSPIIILVIFFITWPYLWQDPLNNTLNILRYYKDIGTEGMGQQAYIIWGGFNLFPIIWIITTTPPIVLFLTLLGITSVFLYRQDKERVALLWLLWLLMPIIRVSVPHSSIYGGIRQIMEFLPALALLSGLGAFTLQKWLKKIFIFYKFPNIVLSILIILMFIPHFWVMKNLHPNENVYFNSLIGGLPGAQKKNIPYWGNSFGNAYLQAVNWLNIHGEPGSKLALVQNTMVNVPKEYIRADINFSNAFWSGINRKGEYLMELTHQGSEVAYPFAWEYVNRVLIPIYEVKVDGVPIAKIWKNDLAHSKKEYQIEKDIKIKNSKIKDETMEIELAEAISLARMIFQFNPNGNCETFERGVVSSSVNGRNWEIEDEKVGDIQVNDYPSLENGSIRYIFPARKAKYIKISTGSSKSCLFQNITVDIKGFN